MSYCLNPKCPFPTDPQNTHKRACVHCGSEMLLQNRYRIIRPMGGGGFGRTFEVDDGGVRKVLKVLLHNHEKAISLFQQEASALARLRHPGIPRVDADGYFTFLPPDSQESLHCLVMEKINGPNLQEWLKKRGYKPITQERAIDWLKQLAEILELVHDNQYFHRDIKPQNIMLRPDGQLVLIDFGAAREVTKTYLIKVDRGQNVTGIVSPGYTPPEQVNGKAVPQSDFFALARTFILLVTGKPPTAFPEHPRTGKLVWRNNAEQISSAFADVLDYMMSPFPGQRPQQARAILQCLAEVEASLGDSQEEGTMVKGSASPLFGSRNGDAAYESATARLDRSTGSSSGSLRSKPSRSTKPTHKPPQVRQQLQIAGIAALVLLVLTQFYGYGRFRYWLANPFSMLYSFSSSLLSGSNLSLEKRLNVKGPVRSVAIDPQEQYIASGSYGTIRLWRIADLNAEPQILPAHDDSVIALAFSPKQPLLASGSGDNTVKLWQPEQGIRILTLTGHTAAINALAFDRQGNWLASGSDDKTVRVWQAGTSNRRYTLQGHTGAVRSLVFSQDSRMLITAGDDTSIIFWNLDLGVRLRTLQGHTTAITALAISPDGRVLASSDMDNNIKLWNVETGAAIATFATGQSRLNALAFAADNAILYAGGETFQIWDWAEGRLLNIVPGHRQPITGITVGAGAQKFLATSSLDTTVKVWRSP